jgi:OmpA-OmpF porin, OOP family
MITLRAMYLFAKRFTLLIGLLCISTIGYGQFKWKKQPSHTWIVGLGFNFVNDNPEIFNRFWFIEERWNAPYFPSRLSLERNLKYGMALGGNLSYNQYRPGKLVQGSILQSGGHLIMIDVYFKYRFNMNYKRVEWFDPYVAIGTGYTARLHPWYQNAIHLSGAVGSNFWLSKTIGVQLETSVKFGLGAQFPAERTNYSQHSISLLYRIYPSKKSKRPKARYKWVHDKPKVKVNRM